MTEEVGSPKLYYANKTLRSKRWWQDGKRHRLDGPAIIHYHIDGSVQCEYWWVRNEIIDIDSFLRDIGIAEMDEEAIVMFGLKYG